MQILSHLSGGFDSAAATLLELEDPDYHTVEGIFFDYGQKYAEQEYRAAQNTSEKLKHHHPLKWKGLLRKKLELEVRSTTSVDFYVPVRNLVLIAASVNVAVALKKDAVSVGNHTVKYRKNDPYCFSDASISFIALLQAVVNECTEENNHIELRMPLILDRRSMAKKEIIEYLLDRDFPIEMFWNCFEGGDKPCGRCFHCLELKTILKEIDSE